MYSEPMRTGQAPKGEWTGSGDHKSSHNQTVELSLKQMAKDLEGK
jgi:hypothetical protein